VDEASLDALKKGGHDHQPPDSRWPGDLKEFSRKEEWTAESGARYVELLEHSADRHSWQFETDEPPLKFLKALSRRWRSLTFLLDYDWEDKRLKGLARAKAGRLRNYCVIY
jgi:hypothetical protein